MINKTIKIDNHVFLTGRPSLTEFLSVVNSQVDYEPSQLGQLSDEWRAANAIVNDMQQSQAGAADKPDYQDMPDSLRDLANQILEDEIFQRSFNIVKPVIRMVELDSMVVFQKHINLNYVEKIKQQLGENPSEETILKTCLPIDHPMPDISAARVSKDAFVFISPSVDIRVLDTCLLDKNQISKLHNQWTPCNHHGHSYWFRV